MGFGIVGMWGWVGRDWGKLIYLYLIDINGGKFNLFEPECFNVKLDGIVKSRRNKQISINHEEHEVHEGENINCFL